MGEWVIGATQNPQPSTPLCLAHHPAPPTPPCPRVLSSHSRVVLSCGYQPVICSNMGGPLPADQRTPGDFQPDQPGQVVWGGFGPTHVAHCPLIIE